MSKSRTQLEQARSAADNILLILKRAASDIGRELPKLNQAISLTPDTTDGSIDAYNWQVLQEIARGAEWVREFAQREFKIVASTSLGRRR